MKQIQITKLARELPKTTRHKRAQPAQFGPPAEILTRLNLDHPSKSDDRQLIWCRIKMCRQSEKPRIQPHFSFPLSSQHKPPQLQGLATGTSHVLSSPAGTSAPRAPRRASRWPHAARWVMADPAATAGARSLRLHASCVEGVGPRRAVGAAAPCSAGAGPGAGRSHARVGAASGPWPLQYRDRRR